MAREYTREDLISVVRRNYPGWPSTFSKCETDGCSSQARGGGLCVECAQRLLAAQVGELLAARFVAAVEHLARLEREIRFGPDDQTESSDAG